ncbi:glycosyltransferase family A protein [uncultured Lutibacter sp.]|uniref:glycosyltransferase family 2 protein n=1 Tax=uncultured Lutibacter sp. TaxID=437739 RepID=UPI00262BAA68|nr:glycosyltransferase family A protein [uncultured Lutibacter sp.]
MNNLTPLISIIIPIYNAEKHLKKCISSVLNQTYDNFELILVNDGSTDNSSLICNNFEKLDKRIKITSQKNKGVSSARNIGINEAKGEYICFVDADDWVTKNYLSHFNLKIDIDLQIQSVRIWHEIDNRIKDVKFSKQKLYKNSQIIEVIEIAERNELIRSPWIKLFKTSIIKDNNIKFNSNISYGEDYIFVLNYLMFISSIYIIDKVNYIYAQRKNNSLSKKYISYEERFNFFKELNLLRKKPINSFYFPSNSYLHFINQKNTHYLTNLIIGIYDKRSNFNRHDRLIKLRELKPKLITYYYSKELNILQKLSWFFLKLFPVIIADLIINTSRVFYLILLRFLRLFKTSL